MKLNLNKTALLLFLSTGALGAAPRTRARFIMGTVCEITAYGENADAAITEAFGEIERLDRVMSLYKPDSELVRLNRAAGQAHPVSEELWHAIDLALAYASADFDPTIASAPGRVGYRRVRRDAKRRAVQLEPGMAIDLGGIGKGIALDRAAEALRRRRIAGALINFGGQIYALGAPPGGAAWRVAAPGRTLSVKDASVSTSGDSERPGHILSPATGRPVRRKESVTVVAASAAAADAWSTALYVAGRPDAFPGCAFFSNQRTPASCGKYVAKENPDEG